MKRASITHNAVLSLFVATLAIFPSACYSEETTSALNAASESTTVSPSDVEVNYYGLWVQVPDAKAPDRRRTSEPFAACHIAFRGDYVRWLGSTGPDHGKAEIYVDGHLTKTIDAYTPVFKAAQILFEVKDLKDDRIHTLRIVVRPERHGDAVDCF